MEWVLVEASANGPRGPSYKDVHPVYTRHQKEAVVWAVKLCIGYTSTKEELGRAALDSL